MTGPEGGLAARARAWRDADPDPETRAELDRLLGSADTEALASRFEGSLSFGTAGIRAEMGAGPMRMNRLVAGRVAAGLARYIAYIAASEQPGAVAGVVIGYDGRLNSRVFATDAARILSRAGIPVWLLPSALPTPVLAFAVRHLGAAYGVMVTASHNPRRDNGIKVYVRDGGQLLPPVDADIAAAIDAVDPMALPAGWAEGPFDFTPADDAVHAYVAAVAAGQGPAADGARTARRAGLKVVHTALHGVGDATLRAVLAAAGWPAPVPVAAQRLPDPGFPTVPYPNPEAPGVLDLARETAEREGADLVLANDPDADRLAVMVPGSGGWRMLTGDELGALLGDAVVGRLTGGGYPVDLRGRPPVVATTVVSGSLLRRLADAASVQCVTTLTGFKWIARAGGDDPLVFGYEQALGYAVRPDLVADKDGISAALLALGLAAELAAQGRTLSDRLDDLAMTHGVHVTRERSLRADGAAGLARLTRAVERVRKEPPSLLAGQPVTVTDLLKESAGVVDLAGGTAERAPGRPIPPADVLIWHAGHDARVMIRPSGTEPVIKLYAEAVRPVRSRADLAAARAAAGEHALAMLAEAAAALEPDGT
ncbi:phospho-sugar mutase [Trebonia kvetii]|nr:phospho-sugar mutase [Trebonia kvetii]